MNSKSARSADGREPEKQDIPKGFEYAVLGGGCFWCLEAVFGQLKGVDSVVSGYAGRWYCPECDGVVAAKNRNDAQYEANKDLPDGDPNKVCIHGYLVFDYFTADKFGRVRTNVVSDGSYHVLWCGATSGSNSYLYNVDTSTSPFSDNTLKCTQPKLCKADDVIPEIERASFTQLPVGSYTDLQVALTEESFHQNCGSWAQVLWNDVSFVVER